MAKTMASLLCVVLFLFAITDSASGERRDGLQMTPQILRQEFGKPQLP